MLARGEAHAVVLGPAAPAQDERVEGLVRLARLGHLLCDLQVTVRRGLERRPDRISPGQELVQAEREDGEAAGIAWVQLRALEQPFAEHLGAQFGVGVRECRKLHRGAWSIPDCLAVLPPRRSPGRLMLSLALSSLDSLAFRALGRLAIEPSRRRSGSLMPCLSRSLLDWLALQPLDRPAPQPPGHLPEKFAGAGLLPNPEGRFDPGCEGMAAERLEIAGRSVLRGDGSANGISDRGVRGIDFGSCAFQRLADDLFRREIHAEQGLGHFRDFEPLVFAAAAARHGGGRADADDVVAECVAAAANEHRDVGALTPAIGMQLVEHEEPEPLGGPHQFAVLDAREQQLQHHVVREQDVRRIAPNRLAGLSPLLPGIAGESNEGLALRVALVDELAELLVLAVGQRVHRIDDDGLDAAAGPAPEHVVHDRHDVGEALAGTRAGCQHIGPASLRLEDRLALVLVQEELLAPVVGVGFADTKDPRAFPVENPQLDQVVDGAAGPERRVELEERFGPEPLGSEDAVDERLDPRFADLDEAARVAPVVGDQAVPEVKDVHVAPSCHARFHGPGRLRRQGIHER